MSEVDEPALGAGTPGIGAIVVVVAGIVLVVLVDVVLVVVLLVVLLGRVVEDPTVVVTGTLEVLVEAVLVDGAVISTLETGSKRHSVASSPSGIQAASARAARTTYRIFIVLCYQ